MVRVSCVFEGGCGGEVQVSRRAEGRVWVFVRVWCGGKVVTYAKRRDGRVVEGRSKVIYRRCWGMA